MTVITAPHRSTVGAESRSGPRYRHERNLGAASSSFSFDLPVDVAVASDGRLFVINRGRSSTEVSAPRQPDTAVLVDEQRLVHRIGIWSFEHDAPAKGPVQRFGGGSGELIWPAGLAISGDRLYVTDEASHDVHVFDLDGTHITTWGRRGAGPGELNAPSGIAIDRDGTILIVDSCNHRIQRFTPDGRLIAAWGERGSGAGQFERPWGIAVNAMGEIYVCDWGNRRVQQFSGAGRHSATINSFDGDPLNRPACIAVDADGFVYITDTEADRVLVFDAAGRSCASLHGEGSLSKRALWFYNSFGARVTERAATPPGDLSRLERAMRHPRGVKIHPSGQLLIADTGRARIQVYERLPESVPDEGTQWNALDLLVRTAAPAWLNSAGLTDQADTLRSLEKLGPVTDLVRLADVLENVRGNAYIAACTSGATEDQQAAYDAARDQVWPVARVSAAGDLTAAARDIIGAAAWAAAKGGDHSATLTNLADQLLVA